MPGPYDGCPQRRTRPSQMRMTRSLTVLGCLAFGCAIGVVTASGAVGQSAVPSSPVSAAAAQLVVGGGPDAGRYALADPPLCVTGSTSPGDWDVSVTPLSGVPASVDFHDDPSIPGSASLLVDFGVDPDIREYALDGGAAEVTIDDRGTTATLTISGPSSVLTATGDLLDGGTVSLALTCGRVSRGPVALPSVAPGTSLAPGLRNHFRIVVTGGPHAGTYDADTTDECLAGVDSPLDWVASFDLPGADPSTATVAVYPDQQDQTALEVDFGTGGSATFYVNIDGQATSTVDDRGDAATLTVSGTAQAYGASGAVGDGGTVTITVECAVILRAPSG